MKPTIYDFLRLWNWSSQLSNAEWEHGGMHQKERESKGETHKEINIGSNMSRHIIFSNIFCFLIKALKCRMIKGNEDFFLHSPPPPPSGSSVLQTFPLTCRKYNMYHSKVDWREFREYELVKKKYCPYIIIRKIKYNY